MSYTGNPVPYTNSNNARTKKEAQLPRTGYYWYPTEDELIAQQYRSGREINTRDALMTAAENNSFEPPKFRAETRDTYPTDNPAMTQSEQIRKINLVKNAMRVPRRVDKGRLPGSIGVNNGHILEDQAVQQTPKNWQFNPDCQ